MVRNRHKKKVGGVEVVGVQDLSDEGWGRLEVVYGGDTQAVWETTELFLEEIASIIQWGADTAKEDLSIYRNKEDLDRLLEVDNIFNACKDAEKRIRNAAVGGNGDPDLPTNVIESRKRLKEQYSSIARIYGRFADANQSVAGNGQVKGWNGVILDGGIGNILEEFVYSGTTFCIMSAFTIGYATYVRNRKGLELGVELLEKGFPVYSVRMGCGDVDDVEAIGASVVSVDTVFLTVQSTIDSTKNKDNALMFTPLFSSLRPTFWIDQWVGLGGVRGGLFVEEVDVALRVLELLGQGVGGHECPSGDWEREREDNTALGRDSVDWEEDGEDKYGGYDEEEDWEDGDED